MPPVVLTLPLPDGSQDTLSCQNSAAATEMRRLRKLCLSEMFSVQDMLVLWAKFYSDHASKPWLPCPLKSCQVQLRIFGQKVSIVHGKTAASDFFWRLATCRFLGETSEDENGFPLLHHLESPNIEAADHIIGDCAKTFRETLTLRRGIWDTFLSGWKTIKPPRKNDYIFDLLGPVLLLMYIYGLP